MTLNGNLNMLLARVARRAEMNDPRTLARTFVEIPEISFGIRTIDHQVIYGRRGSGKTHAFNHLSVELGSSGDLPIYLDLRRIGSNAGLYADDFADLPQRASRLLIDVLAALHSHLLQAAIEEPRCEGMLEHLDALADASTRIKVDGSVTSEEESEGSVSAERGTETAIGLTGSGPDVSMKLNRTFSASARGRRKVTRAGSELPHLMFGELGSVMESIAGGLGSVRLWLLLDEWSSLPTELQPFLADMLRRTFFTTAGITVKIGAIERRSAFRIGSSTGTYVGLELGADTASALNLDEHLLEPEAGPEARDFLASLLFKHLSVLYEDTGIAMPFRDPVHLTETMFAQGGLRDFVRAAEGVPRDAINIIGLAAMSAKDNAIRPADLQRAARNYYLRDKETGIAGNPRAQFVWDELQRQIVLGQDSRTFLLRRRDTVPVEILDLFDARLIHLIKRGFVARSRPGYRFDGYSIDYGCYAQVLNEAQINAAWAMRFSSREHPGDTRSYLTDRFDDQVIFDVAQSKRKGRQRPG